MLKNLQENLKLFYIGLENNEPFMYKNKDLTTHALIIGMSGSGKTGLGLSLLEEACIDNIPSIIIDPKGDLANLALSFASKEEYEGFEQKNCDELFNALKNGLESSYQDLSRIELLKQSASVKIYTPKSEAGVPINLLGDFLPPKNPEEMESYTLNLASSVLALAGLDTSDSTSPALLLLQNIFFHNFSQNKALNITDLLGQIITPPFESIGVFGIDSFYPTKDRMNLAKKLNALVASPAFALWCKGESLDISKMLFDDSGKAVANVFCISHLNDAERMFFVSILLNALISWMRAQEGSEALRAVFYMDEIFGYFPPNGNPPSKTAMLTLLKQARAFGLGCVLSTQNPVDIDYKGLGNISTYFVGRLQTTQDKERVLGALSSVGADKKELENMINSLKKREFLLKNANDNSLRLIKTRQALCYLKGPLNKEQISYITAKNFAKSVIFNQNFGLNSSLNSSLKTSSNSTLKSTLSNKPILSPNIKESYYINSDKPLKAYLYARAKVKFSDAKAGQICKEFSYLLDASQTSWQEAQMRCLPSLQSTASSGSFEQIPNSLSSKTDLKKELNAFKDFLYREQKERIFSAAGLCSKLGESKEEFYLRLQDKANEILEAKTDEILKKFHANKARLELKLQSANNKVAREQNELSSAGINALTSVAGALIGAFLGKKTSPTSLISKTNRAIKEKSQLSEAKAAQENFKEQIYKLQQSANDEINALKAKYDIRAIELITKEISPKKSDIFDESIELVWIN